ncbi:acyl-CoA dehydrogenase family protein [Burkholderia sp. R-69980]|nr:acyl-CoA dehydrogenase family protein [Burkholderia sp. R-69980]
MDLSYGRAYEQFRDEVHDFLVKRWLPLALQVDAGELPRRDAHATLRSLAVARGYLYRSVPRRYGGSEQEPDLLKAQIIREQFDKVRAPTEVPGVGVSMVVPTLLECGTPWQRDLFIPPTLAGDYMWAQGYSEPGAGSDLASVRTRGELVGNEWVINGQKTWSSLAHKAQFMFALVRTESAAERHAGLSYLLLDLRQPSVTIRPLRQITGDADFCEVFFDNARTPADWVVGERGAGWTVSKATLSHERGSFIGGASNSVMLFDKLVELAGATTLDDKPAIHHPVIRERLTRLEGYVASHRYSSYRQLSMVAHGQDPGISTLMNKLQASNIAQEVAAIAREIIGDAFMLTGSEDRRSAGPEKWINQYLGSLGMAIAGGTSNIQRNVIAERGLGLPRDSRAQTTASTPSSWRAP